MENKSQLSPQEILPICRLSLLCRAYYHFLGNKTEMLLHEVKTFAGPKSSNKKDLHLAAMKTGFLHNILGPCACLL
jgi:hypothetical protein